ncbi:ATP-binding cassette sub-family a member 2 [Plakobranchus ocellatus]|uniref:ATP-binding cassette sub-family a member 2 n=1 Tax=Plakobranchus ocellatus TaxID=259542 RepID=A0AAV3YK86_9GAST|nr:ATP-binding cassette sub-family a member 2 [Plakobranchus ocellatus]
MFIPLVLFVILLLIREKLPASKMAITRYHAMALPSTGLLSLIQMFCAGDEDLDPHGFRNGTTESQVDRLLEKLQAVARDHDFFRPGLSPQEMDDLPQMYQAVIDDPAFMIDALKNASDVQLGSVLRDRPGFLHFLTHNLSLPLDEANAFTDSEVHVKEVYHYIFGGRLSKTFPQFPFHRRKRSVEEDGDEDKVNISDSLEETDVMKNSLSSLLSSSISSLFSSSPSSSISSPSLLLKLLPLAGPDLLATGVQEMVRAWLSQNAAKLGDNSAQRQELIKIIADIMASTGASNSEVQHRILASIIQSGMSQLQQDDQRAVIEAVAQLLAGHFGSVGQGSGDDALSSIDGLRVLQKVLEIVEAQPHSIIIQPEQLAAALKSVLQSPHFVRLVMCDNETFVEGIVPPDSTNANVTGDMQSRLCHLSSAQMGQFSQELNSQITNEELVSLEDMQSRLCHLSSAQMGQFSQELYSQITNEELVSLLNLKPVNLTATAFKLSAFLNKAERFMKFQRELEELSQLISLMPFDVEHATGEDMTITPVTNTTGQPTDGAGGKSGKKPAGWVKIWNFLHRTVCGNHPNKHKSHHGHSHRSGQTPGQPAENVTQANTPAENPKQDGDEGHKDKDNDDEDMENLVMTRAQRDKMSIIKHYLYHNPTILYAPNSTAADNIITKANTTVAFIDLITTYAKEWLNISHRLHLYLARPKTDHNLLLVKKMQEDIVQHRSVLSWLFQLHDLSPFLGAKIFSSEHYDHQLNLIDAAAKAWLSMMKGINLNIFRGFATEEEMLDYFLTQAYRDNASIIAGVVFQDLPLDGSMPPHVRYKIRQNATYLPSTKQVRKPTWVPGPGQEFYPYYQFGFVWVQEVIERAIIDLQVGRDVVEPGSYIRQFPYPCYVWDQFMFMIEHVMPLCLTFSWVYSVAMLVQSIVYEKEQRLKEVMKMMGLNNAVHWCAWFVTTFVQMTISVLILTVLLKMGNVLPNSNTFIIFVVLEIYICAIISFSFLISVLYSKAKVAAACAGIIYFLSYVPYMYIAIKEDIAGDHISGVWKTLASLFSTTAFGLGAKYFAFYEEMGTGVQWSNMYISPTESDEFNLFMVTLMMVVDSVLYCVLVWYIEHVHPGSYGLPKPWYFPLMKSYWCGGNKHVEHCGLGNPFTQCCCPGLEHLSLVEEDQACAMVQDPDHASRFEPDPIHLPLGVCIDNLTKVYKLGKKTAVNNLSLNLYEGQITSFLGHNGAGKTTTMSMLTGMIPPTAGTASVYNYDIRTDMDIIRQSLGLCPQHNVLFDQFTVEEHLWFFANLKGMKAEDIQKETDRMIEDLGLPDKRRVRVDCLSGGMQRKLSVAIAFVGGSRTVILDEPTAGVDPYARRAIWDLLVKFKKDRTILLSTHHMDEADFLGDRIAIISNGQLKCCGSSIFLKNMIGEGYHLTFSKMERKLEENEGDEDEENEKKDGDSEKAGKSRGGDKSKPTITLKDHPRPLGMKKKPESPCQEARVTAFVQKYVNSAYLVSENTRELHYILPFEEAKKGCFERLFSNLDASLADLWVTSYGVMDTNLEEIFLKVTEAALNEEEGQTAEEKPLETFSSDVPTSPIHHTAPPSYPQAVASSPATSLTNLLLLDRTGVTQGAELAGAPPTLPEMAPSLASSAFTQAHARYNKNITCRQGINNSDGYDEDDDDDFYSQYATVEGAEAADEPLLIDHLVLEDYSADRADGDLSMINLAALGEDRSSVPRPVASDSPRILLEGRGSHMLNPKLLLANHFKAVIIKRFHYITRNWRSLFSQIILPAIFVAVAMTVALAAPSVDDLPPLELSTTQFTNVTLPTGNFVPFTDERMSKPSKVNPLDASAYQLQATLALPSGIGASCLLKSPAVTTLNSTDSYETGCQWMFDNHYRLHGPDQRGLMINLTNTETGEEIQFSDVEYYPHNCVCKADGTGFICSSEKYRRPPGFRSVTLDWLNNITGQHTEDYLLYTFMEQFMHRYGGLAFGQVQGFVPVDFGFKAPTLFRKLAVRNVATTWFNHKGLHSMGVYLNSLNNAILRANLPPEKGNPAAYGMTVFNHPWNDTDSQLSSLDYILEGSDVLISIFIIAAMSFVPASFVVFLVYEKSTKAKHLQFVTGMNPVMYWIGNYVWDMCNYVIPAFMCVMILLIFQIPAYVSADNLPAVITLFLMYGWSMTPLMYPASFWFKEPSTAYIALIVINLFTGITCIVCSFLLEIFSYDHDLERVHKVLKLVFMMFPNYCLGRGLMELAFNEYKNEYLFKTEIHNPQLDMVYKTRKLGRHLAVDRLCLGVPPGECFGLLGVNGAGKTTTFKMLTGDLEPSSGAAFLNGYSVNKDIKKLGLTNYADKLSGTYSGGNKRKLSTAIALIGHPPIIFMDEPTTGMDPHSRRFLWDLILGLVQDGRSVILTSHSMEECEALCSRMAIMVNGTFKCLGSSTHLKNRFGDGYTFTIRVRGPDYMRSRREVTRFIERNIPEAQLKEEHYNIVQYEIKTRPVSLAMLFSKLEEAESKLSIEDYSVSQNTLDNVFINFVKQQTGLVQDDSEDDSVRQPSLGSRLRSRASTLLMGSGFSAPVQAPVVLPVDQASDDSLDLSDDDMALTLDTSDGTRLTMMPL